MGPDRCFIVRIDPELDELVEQHRQWLRARRGRRSVSLAEAARDLLRRGLEERGKLPRRRPKPKRAQLELWR